MDAIFVRIHVINHKPYPKISKDSYLIETKLKTNINYIK